MTVMTQAPALYWTARQFNEPVAEWAARMAEEYAASHPAALARLDRIGKTEQLIAEDGPVSDRLNPGPGDTPVSKRATVWVSVTSHRARGRLMRTVPDPGVSYGVSENWPPRGEYYEVPAWYADTLTRIKGLRVLRGTPGNGASLFRYLTRAELGGPEPGNWPVNDLGGQAAHPRFGADENDIDTEAHDD